MASVSFDTLVEPHFLDHLTSMPLSEVRACRRQADEVETGLSYLRRLTQGRLDIVVDDRRRRTLGEGPRDVAALVDDLPKILGDRLRAPGVGRLPTLMAPGEVDEILLHRLDEIVAPSKVGSLPTLSDSELDAAATELVVLEREISARRRAVHQVLDRLQGEIVRRYQTGEANVDDLLA